MAQRLFGGKNAYHLNFQKIDQNLAGSVKQTTNNFIKCAGLETVRIPILHSVVYMQSTRHLIVKSSNEGPKTLI